MVHEAHLGIRRFALGQRPQLERRGARDQLAARIEQLLIDHAEQDLREGEVREGRKGGDGGSDDVNGREER